MTHARNILALLVLAGLILRFAWVGYLGSDDVFYADGARGWLAHFPGYVGDTHWSLRHTFVLPLALSFKLFGETEFALSLISVLYFLALLIATYAISATQFGPRIAFAIGLALATTPVFAIWSTIATPDIAETFFVVASLWLFFRASQNNDSLLFFAAGLIAGFAWLTRETALMVVIFYGILFIAGYRVPRSRYLIIGLGFLLPVLSEMIYFWVQTGDPLYRLWVDMDQGRSRGATQHGGTGNLEINRWLNPWLAVLVNQNFALLYFFLIFPLIWLGKQAKLKQLSPWLLLMGLLVVVSFLTIAYIIPVRKLPRYFEVSTYGAVVVTVAWLGLHIWRRNKMLASALYAALLLTNLLAIYLDNRQPLFGERALVTWVESHRTPIYTDPATYDLAQFLLNAHSLTGLVHSTPPPPGAYFFYNPKRVNTAADNPTYGQLYTPAPGWAIRETIGSQPKLIGLILAKVGAAGFFPDRIMRKLSNPTDPVVVYQVISTR